MDKFKIEFTCKKSDEVRVRIIDSQDEARAYEWAEKQIEAWVKSGSHDKWKAKVTPVEIPKQAPIVRIRKVKKEKKYE